MLPKKGKGQFLQNKPVTVAGDPERRSGIVLAACPLAKKFDITTAETLGSAKLKSPHLEVIRLCFVGLRKEP